eukprot:9484086-Pyramimonas_sp.AAC.1
MGGARARRWPVLRRGFEGDNGPTTATTTTTTAMMTMGAATATATATATAATATATTTTTTTTTATTTLTTTATKKTTTKRMTTATAARGSPSGPGGGTRVPLSEPCRWLRWSSGGHEMPPLALWGPSAFFVSLSLSLFCACSGRVALWVQEGPREAPSGPLGGSSAI